MHSCTMKTMTENKLTLTLKKKTKRNCQEVKEPGQLTNREVLSDVPFFNFIF